MNSLYFKNKHSKVLNVIMCILLSIKPCSLDFKCIFKCSKFNNIDLSLISLKSRSAVLIEKKINECLKVGLGSFQWHYNVIKRLF